MRKNKKYRGKIRNNKEEKEERVCNVYTLSRNRLSKPCQTYWIKQ